MSVFPDIFPSYGYTITPTYRTLKLGPTDGDFIQRRRKRTSPLHTVAMTWNALSGANEKTLYDFYISMSGSWQAFAFFDFDAKNYTAIAVGIGDGSATAFNLVAKATSGRTVYVNGVAKTEGTDYTFYAGQGTDGQDKIIFTTAPGNSLPITADYAGRKYLPKCIFQADDLNRNTFSVALYRTGLGIMEVSA